VTPEKLAKIRALAEDLRGDPATREIARAALRRYAKEEPLEFHDVPPAPENPAGMRNAPEYEQYVFMSLRNWGRVKSTGNFVHTCSHKGRGYRVVLFSHKKTPTFGWLRVDVASNVEVWSGKFSDLQGAHRNAWESLKSI
jgi:hypothetical protein